jgi:hypothetical protein
MIKMLEVPMVPGLSPQPEVDPNKEKINALRKRHSLYEKYCGRWNFYLSAYEGGEDFACRDNLFRHTRENEADFEDRLKRLDNWNYCETLVDFFTNFIFSESIDRSGGSNESFFQDFIQDVNLRGDTIDEFMTQVSDDSQIFGMSLVQVDAPKKADNVVTKQQEKDAGIRPYWILVKPEEVLDWIVDPFDRFIYLKRRQFVTELIGSTPTDVEMYVEFTTDEVKVSKIDVTDPDKPKFLGSEIVPNTFGEVPFVVTRYKRSKIDPHMGASFLRDFAGNQRKILNLSSMLDEFLYRQAFNILAKEVEQSIPLAEQEEGVVGTANVMEVPKGAAMPQYISPPVDPAEFIQGERQRIKNEMFSRAAQDFLNELFNGEKSSGFSQAQSFAKTVPFISRRADRLESMENALMRMTMRCVNKEWDGKIKYKDRYEVTNITDALTQLQILVRDFQLPSETFVKEELKRMVLEYDGKLPKDILVQVKKEIDEMDFAGWLRTQKQALVGRGQSPSEQQKPKGTGTLEEARSEARVGVASTKKLKPSREKQ